MGKEEGREGPTHTRIASFIVHRGTALHRQAFRCAFFVARFRAIPAVYPTPSVSGGAGRVVCDCLPVLAALKRPVRRLNMLPSLSTMSGVRRAKLCLATVAPPRVKEAIVRSPGEQGCAHAEGGGVRGRGAGRSSDRPETKQKGVGPRRDVKNNRKTAVAAAATTAGALR